MGTCESGYCEKDGQRITREQLASSSPSRDSGPNDVGTADASPISTPSSTSDGARACVSPSFPTPACAGVPEGVEFAQTIEGQYLAVKDGETLERWHITGDLVIRAAHVTISNSQIDGTITNEYDPAVFGGPFVIVDSTVGPATGCIVTPGIADQNYTAIRVYVRGHDDGFRAGGPEVTVQDSYVKSCITDTSHGVGIQDYPYTRNLVFDHNTIDLCGEWTGDRSKPCQNLTASGSIFVASDPAAGNGTTNVRITNNLVMGGDYPLFLRPETQGRGGTTGTWLVSGNRVVDGAWTYGPFEASGNCANVTEWSDNTIVTIDSAYNVTSTIRTEPCPN